MEFIGRLENDNFLLESSRDIIIFGASGSGEKVLKKLQAMGVRERVKGFTDNNQNIWGKKLQGINIYSPLEMIQLFNEPMVIIASIYDKEICQQLCEIGCKGIHLPVALK